MATQGAKQSVSGINRTEEERRTNKKGEQETWGDGRAVTQHPGMVCKSAEVRLEKSPGLRDSPSATSTNKISGRVTFHVCQLLNRSTGN